MRQATLTMLQAVCKGLQDVATEIRVDTNAVTDTGNHVDIVRHYDQVRHAAELIKESREAIKQIEEQLSRETIPDVFRAAKVKTTTIEGVGRVTVSYRYSCSMLDKEAGLEWLRANGHDGLIQETVNSATLSAFAKGLLENEGRELPPDIFKTGTQPFTSITKVK